jgi:CMP-N,N'-diacetyllegionaminic acid synthase
MRDIVALVPARSGSERVPDKNIRLLDGHPLMAHTIAAARACGIFNNVIVSTDSDRYADIASGYGASIVMRPAQISTSRSPDIEWVRSALGETGMEAESFAILRPTSPFRTKETISRAWDQWTNLAQSTNVPDSLRAIEVVHQHPGKMWIDSGSGSIVPLLLQPADQPWHSSQMQTLPLVYVQNASLEIAWTRTVMCKETISGDTISAFFTSEMEGFDINTELDIRVAQMLIREGDITLPDPTP